MKLKKFLETYTIIERVEIIQEHELEFSDLKSDDNDLMQLMIDKSSYKFVQEYSANESVTLYDVFLDDTYRKEIKSDLTYEQLEEFIESL